MSTATHPWPTSARSPSSHPNACYARGVLHVALHIALPVLIAALLYRPRWQRAALIMGATLLVDLDHLLAVPVYDPERCSIGFHPLHGLAAIALYAALFVLTLALGRRLATPAARSVASALSLVGLGLLLHMALDWGDCLL